MGDGLSDKDHLAGFPAVCTFPVLWGDQDAFGHVNNIVYLRWCETARVEYLERTGMWQEREGRGVGPILASISVHYRRPVRFPDRIRVGARVTKIGNSSFHMDHALVSETMGALVATVTSVIVVYDYDARKSVPMPPAIRQAIERMEGRVFEAAR